MVLDIEKFGDPVRSDLHREIAHEGLYNALNTALSEADIDPKSCQINDRGDGALILVPDAVPGGRLADDLPLRLNSNLLRYNAGCAVEARIRLRMSLHRGDARLSNNGVVGDAVNFACRLVDAAGVRKVHQQSDELIAIIVSEIFYREVVQHDPAARPELYRAVEVRVKEVRTTAWVRSTNRISSNPDHSQVAHSDVPNGPFRVGSPGVGKHVEQGLLWPLVQALSRVPALATRPARDHLVDLLRERVRDELVVPTSQYPIKHLFGIAEACCEHPGALGVLLEVLAGMESDTSTLSDCRAAIRDLSALDLWPDEEREQLFGLLAGVVVPDIAEIFRRVAGESVPRLRGQTSYAEMFGALEDLNAGPTGVPRPLLFVEQIALRVDINLAGELRRWAEEQAKRMDLHAELLEVRRGVVESSANVMAPPQKSKAYLVMQIQSEGPTGARFRLAHWRQLELSSGWAPLRGKDVVGDRESMKHHVAAIIERAEVDWLEYQPEIRLEFVLAYENLDLDVEQWPWETDSPIPEPLGCRYTVSIRSLERMTLVKYHGSWRKRWESLRAQVDSYGAIPPIACLRVTSSGNDDLRALMAELNRRSKLVALVLARPPHRKHAGQDAVAVAVRAGVPVIAWLRDADPGPESLAAIEEMLSGVDDVHHLLERVRRMRNTAFGGGAEDRHLGARLALIYDDPFRGVVPTQPTPPEGASVA